MRNLIVTLVLGALAACGASRQQVEVARTARYRGDKLAMFHAARVATIGKYRITMSDENTLRIETAGRWYTPDGLGASERDDMRDVPDRSIHLRMIVKLVPRGDDWGVEIEPVMMRYFAGRPNPDHLAPDDPSLPGWAHGRVDQLYSAIHQALGSFQVAQGGVTPRISTPPAPPPAAPPPTEACPPMTSPNGTSPQACK